MTVAPEPEPELPPLYYASVANDLEEVKRLLESGADPNDGESIYHAAEKHHRAVIDLLIALGADVNVRDRQFGSSPLGWAGHDSRACRAADDDYCAVVDLLRAAGATREASINRWNETPEGMATSRVADRLTRRLDP